MERRTVIETVPSPWQGLVLPLYQHRLNWSREADLNRRWGGYESPDLNRANLSRNKTWCPMRDLHSHPIKDYGLNVARLLFHQSGILNLESADVLSGRRTLPIPVGSVSQITYTPLGSMLTVPRHFYGLWSLCKLGSRVGIRTRV